MLRHHSFYFSSEHFVFFCLFVYFRCIHVVFCCSFFCFFCVKFLHNLCLKLLSDIYTFIDWRSIFHVHKILSAYTPWLENYDSVTIWLRAANRHIWIHFFQKSVFWRSSKYLFKSVFGAILLYFDVFWPNYLIYNLFSCFLVYLSLDFWVKSTFLCNKNPS